MILFSCSNGSFWKVNRCSIIQSKDMLIWYLHLRDDGRGLWKDPGPQKPCNWWGTELDPLGQHLCSGNNCPAWRAALRLSVWTSRKGCGRWHFSLYLSHSPFSLEVSITVVGTEKGGCGMVAGWGRGPVSFVLPHDSGCVCCQGWGRFLSLGTAS